MEDITVEKFLELQMEIMIEDFRKHSRSLVEKLKTQEKEASNKILKNINKEHQTQQPLLCLTLKCIEGPHTGQKFRLEVKSIYKEGDLFLIHILQTGRQRVSI